MKAKIFDMAGKKVGEIALNPEFFEQEYNEALVHQVVKAFLANQRQGTKSALTRTEVRGGGCKPFRQKGTGNARQGSITAPQHTGGGIVFAPKPRDFEQKINKKAKRAAFFSALSEKARQNEITVVDAITLEEIKTKVVANMLGALKLDGSTVIVTAENDNSVVLAANNIPGVSVQEIGLLSVYDIVSNKNLLLTKDVLTKLEEK